jgi:hypothetical protein
MDCTPKASGLKFSTNEHGCESLFFNVRMPYRDASEFVARKQVLHAKVFTDGSPVWSGRVDQTALVDSGISVSALGHYTALGDIPYLVLWSDTDIGNWQELTLTNFTNTAGERFEIKIGELIEIYPRKNESFSTASFGRVGWHIPNSSSRDAVTITFSYEFLAPATWVARQFCVGAADTFDTSWAGGGSAVNTTLNGSGALQTGTVTNTLSFGKGVVFDMYYNSAVVTAFTGETNSAYFKIYDIRVKSTATSTVTGQEIAQNIVSVISTANSNELSSSTTFVGNPNTDIKQLICRDSDTREVLDLICKQGDSSGNLWSSFIWYDKRLVLEQRGASGRVFFTDVESVDITKSVNEGLYNSGYTAYRTPGGDDVRTSTSTNSASVNDYGLTRRRVLDDQTTDATQAGYIRDTFLTRHAVAVPKASIVISKIYDKNGVRVPLYSVRAFDTIVVRNLLSTGTTSDKIRIFTLSGTRYNADNDTLEIIPESEVDSLQSVL